MPRLESRSKSNSQEEDYSSRQILSVYLNNTIFIDPLPHKILSGRHATAGLMPRFYCKELNCVTFVIYQQYLVKLPFRTIESIERKLTVDNYLQDTDIRFLINESF